MRVWSLVLRLCENQDRPQLWRLLKRSWGQDSNISPEPWRKSQRILLSSPSWADVSSHVNRSGQNSWQMIKTSAMQYLRSLQKNVKGTFQPVENQDESCYN